MENIDSQFYMKVWGARGSIPTPGPETVKYGGNTSCLEIRCGNELLIFDAGTGLRPFGNELLKEMPVKAKIFLSHAHWDHIQGFPFFVPAYIPGNEFHLYGQERIDVEEILRLQMTSPNFPVTLDEMQSEFQFHHLNLRGTIVLGDIKVEYDQLNHPNGVTGFRINYNGKSIVYATDTEHYSCIDKTLLDLTQDADILIYDAQYTHEEYCGIHGSPKTKWGHSTWNAAVELAKAANIKQLVLWHHDPGHNDDFVGNIENQAKQHFPNTIAAYEGLTLQL